MADVTIEATNQAGEVVAWRERDGDEWVYYDADSDTGKHIAAYQRDRHNVSVFPLLAALASNVDDTNLHDGGIIATHAAQPDTFIVYTSKGKAIERHPVILWGVSEHGVVVPMTMNGTWDDQADANSFVLFPSGDCSRYERIWANIDQALVDMSEG